MTINTPIYLDYASTTPVAEPVAEQMMRYLTVDGTFANPASRAHRFGWQAEEAVDVARNQVADLLNCDPREIVFTSGATESDNLALKGVAQAYREKGRHIVSMTTEHKAVLDSLAALESMGWEVTYLAPQSDGLLDLDDLRSALRPDTVLVSVMHVNNEIGTVQDIASIGAICREQGVLFHVDAAQGVGKLAIDLSELPIDLLSLSAHKLYGPKGIGALYVRRRPKVNLVAQQHGGGHERGMRSGTLPTHQIVGLGAACELAAEKLVGEHERMTQLSNKLWQRISELPDVYLNGSETNRLPSILNVSFGGVDGESLMMGLHDVAVSSGSACTSASLEPSYVILALGRSKALAHSALRFSFGRYTTEEEIDFVAQRVIEVVHGLRIPNSATK